MKPPLVPTAVLAMAMLAAACGSDNSTAERPTVPSDVEPTTTPETATTQTAEPEEAAEEATTSLEVVDAELAGLPMLYQDFIAASRGSKWVDVLGSKMHYVDVGDPDGEVILLGHGAPTNAFLWRDVMDPLSMSGRRVIAFDLIGFGRSDHPDLDYSFETHSEYLGGFIEALGLTGVHLVLHDVSGQAGFGYAAANPDNVASIVSGEVLYRSFGSLDEMGSLTGPFFEQLQTPGVGEAMMIEQNMAVTVLLDNGTATDLPAETREVYGAFFVDPESRDVNLDFARSTPIAGQPEEAAAFVDANAAWLAATDIPQLVIRPEAGLVPGVQYDTASTLPSVTVVDLPSSGHFFQEDSPTGVAAAINEFYSSLGI